MKTPSRRKSRSWPKSAGKNEEEAGKGKKKGARQGRQEEGRRRRRGRRVTSSPSPMSKVKRKWIIELITLDFRPWTLDRRRCFNRSARARICPARKKRSCASGRSGAFTRQSLAHRRRHSAVRVLRRAADGQRHAAPGALPDAGDQGSLPALQDDARLPLRAQSGLGYARPAGRGRGLQRAGHPLEGRDRELTASSRSSTAARRASGGTCRSGSG